MLKNLTRGSLKVGCKMVVGVYVHLIMTVIYALATLIGGSNGLKAVKDHKKQIRLGILGLTGGCIGLKVASVVKDTYLLCERVGYTWLIELFTVRVGLNIILLGTLIYFIVNLIKAYSNRQVDTSNKLLVAIIEMVAFVGITLVMAFTSVPNSYYLLLGAYPVIKWVIKNRLSLVISTVVENNQEVNVEDIRANLMERMGKITDKVNQTIETVKSEETVTTETTSDVVDNDLSWDDLGIVERHIEEQLTSESLATTEDTNTVEQVKSEVKIVTDTNNVTLASDVEPKPAKKLNLKIIKNMGTQKAPERRVVTEQLNESIADLLNDVE